MSLTIKFKMNPSDFVEKARRFGDAFVEGARLTHDMWVMRVLEYIVKFSRVDTGRSRAAWFPFMDTKGYDYYRSLPGTRGEDASNEGRAQGFFTSEPFRTTIVNNVAYVDPMNRRFGLFGFAQMVSGKMYLGSAGIHFEEKIPLFEQYGAENFQRFLDNAESAFGQGGRSFDPGDISPVVNDPPMTQ